MRTLLFGLALVLASTAQAQAHGPCLAPIHRVGFGTGGGALAGALIARAVAGKRDNTAAILGGAALGGIAGNILLDRPYPYRYHPPPPPDALVLDEQQRLRAIEERVAAHQAAVAAELAQRGLLPAPLGAPARAEDVSRAQRLLMALGYYQGSIDGIAGPQTRSGVMQFEQAQGLPPTGQVTPALVQRMRTMF